MREHFTHGQIIVTTNIGADGASDIRILRADGQVALHADLLAQADPALVSVNDAGHLVFCGQHEYIIDGACNDSSGGIVLHLVKVEKGMGDAPADR